MIVVIVLAALAVMAIAAIAGTGRFGQWQEPVNDRRKGHLPAGPPNEEWLQELRIPSAMHGYSPSEVDELLERVTRGSSLRESPRFGIVRNGYDMQFVDRIIAQCSRTDNQPSATIAAEDAGRMVHSENKE